MAESLFSLMSEYRDLRDWARSDNELDEVTFNDTMESMLAQIDDKAGAYIATMKMLDSDITLAKNEIANLQVMVKRIEHNKEKMLDALKNMMIETGRTKIETDLHTIKLVNNGGKLPLKITALVPEEYCRKEIKITPDNDAIREALEDGAELDFAHFEPRGKRVKID